MHTSSRSIRLSLRKDKPSSSCLGRTEHNENQGVIPGQMAVPLVGTSYKGDTGCRRHLPYVCGGRSDKDDKLAGAQLFHAPRELGAATANQISPRAFALCFLRSLALRLRNFDAAISKTVSPRKPPKCRQPSLLLASARRRAPPPWLM